MWKCTDVKNNVLNHETYPRLCLKENNLKLFSASPLLRAGGHGTLTRLLMHGANGFVI